MIAEVVSEVVSSVQFNIPRRLSTSRNSKAAFRETHSVLNLGSSVSEERCAWRVGKRRLYTVEHLVVLYHPEPVPPRGKTCTISGHCLVVRLPCVIV